MIDAFWSASYRARGTVTALAMALSRCTLFVFAATIAGCGPLGPMPGGRLGGEVHAQAVGDWSFTEAEQTVQIETNPTAPHSVNTWCVGLGPRLYVPTSMIRGPKTPTDRDWVKNVTADPRMRIRIDGEVYEVVAVRVTDPAEYATARAGLEKKYELGPTDLDPEREIWIFRLDPRSA